MNRKNVLYSAFGIAISVFFLYLSLKNVSWNQLKNAFSQSHPVYIIPIFLGILTFYWMKAVRCCLLLFSAKEISVTQLFPYMMAGITINHFVLGQAGDITRMYLVGSRMGLKYSTVAASILLEWIIDFLVILLLLFGLIPFKTVSYNLLYDQLSIALLIASLAIIAVAGAGIFWYFGFLNPNWEPALLGFKSLTKRHLLLKTLAASFIMWVMMGCSHYCALRAAGLALPIEAPLVLVFLIVISVIVPSAPARIGVIELSYVLGLQLFNVEASSAIVAAFFYHICLSLSIVLLGLFSLTLQTSPFKDHDNR